MTVLPELSISTSPLRQPLDDNSTWRVRHRYQAVQGEGCTRAHYIVGRTLQVGLRQRFVRNTANLGIITSNVR